MRWVAIVTGMVAAAATIAPLAHAGMIPQSRFSYSRWNGAGWTDDKSGAFSHCAVQSTYTGGTTLMFAVHTNGSVTIGFTRPGWTFKPGEEIAGEIRIDQRYTVHAIGVAYLPMAVRVDFPATDPIFTYLQVGREMTVSTTAGAVSYNLKDSFPALEMTRRCAAKYGTEVGVAAQNDLELGVAGRNNLEAQRWIAQNPWFSNPQYAELARTAEAIDYHMRAEGKDATTAAYYAELDERLRKTGAVIPVPPPPTQPASPPPAAAHPETKTFEADGSGFVVSIAGHIITNNHVIDGCVSNVHGNLPGESPIDVRVVSTDEENDLALLIAPAQLEYAATIRNVAIHPGESIIAIGYPYYGILSGDLTVTTGIISSLAGIGNDSRYLQISAPIQPGNSGGPLIDSSGNVVGVVSDEIDAAKIQKITGTVPQNVNFAIKTGALRDFLDKNAVAYATAPPGAEVKTADIAARARFYTMRIWCTARASE